METREPYKPHPSAALNRAFAVRPFQGVEPEKARFLFVGLDANYDPKIEESRIFSHVLEYHEDGVRFWRRYEVHHPFLLKGYNGKGQFYHRVFSRIGFRPEQAPEVSFIELLHVPTCNQSKLMPADLDRGHLLRIRRAIEEGNARYIFVSDRVGKLMLATGIFPWMRKTPSDEGGPLNTWAKFDSKTVYWHYHFSSYGKVEQRKAEQLHAIGRLAGIADRTKA